MANIMRVCDELSPLSLLPPFVLMLAEVIGMLAIELSFDSKLFSYFSVFVAEVDPAGAIEVTCMLTVTEPVTMLWTKMLLTLIFAADAIWPIKLK